MKQKPKVAIIGAGVAGLSAAVYLHEDANVTLFEASNVAGGRARTLNKNVRGFDSLDNGQHILIGAYQNTFNLLKQIGVTEEEAFLRYQFKWLMDNGVKISALPSYVPMNMLLGVLLAKKLSLSEKKELIKSLYLIIKESVDNSVQGWLEKNHVSIKLQQSFWHPLVLATMNTPITEASVLTLSNVIATVILGGKRGSDILLPKKNLGEIFAEPAIDFLKNKKVSCRFNHRVKSVRGDCIGKMFVDDEPFDVVLIATASAQAVKLVEDIRAQELLNQLQYATICTVYLHYPHEVSFPSPMVGVVDGTAHWLFDRGAMGGAKNEVAAVISCFDETVDNESLVKNIHADVKQWCKNIQEPVDYLVIKEKKATAKSTVGRAIGVACNVLISKGIYLAGDYVHQSYPATIEGAIQSGQIAASTCLLDWSNNYGK